MARQREKLDLEIKSLRKKNRWELRSHFLPPVIAAFVAITGFFLTVYQFQSRRSDEQRKDRISREIEQTAKFQNQIRADVDEILRPARDQRQTAARVSFLLEDMKTVMASKVNETDTFSKVFSNYERGLTETLTILVRDDYEFTKNPGDLSCANAVIEHWADYKNYLKGEPGKLDYILYKYTEAMQNLRDQNPGYLECMGLDQKTQQVRECDKYERQKDSQLRYDHFANIVKGFLDHVEIIGEGNLSAQDGERRNKILLDFQEALCNQAVSEHFLGTRIPGGACGNRRPPGSGRRGGGKSHSG